MALADYTAYTTALTSGQLIPTMKSAVSVVANRFSSHWLSTPNAGAIPSTAATCDNTTAGALPFFNGTATQRLAQVMGASSQGGFVVLCDRLSHQGGLSAITTGAQTTNLPTAALPRYTTGAGVMAMVEIYSIVGTTATTISASYTNTSGTSGRTSTSVVFGGTSFRELQRAILLPPQQGDKGFKSVESVSIPLSTGTAGNFGVTLFKPLMAWPLTDTSLVLHQQIDSLLGFGGAMPDIQNNACLFFLQIGFAVSTGNLGAVLRIIDNA